MTVLGSFSAPMRVAVFGASGGIGRAMCEQIAANRCVATLYAGARQTAAAAHDGVRPFAFDLTDETTIASAAATISAEGPLDLVIVATGLLHGADLQPEKTWRDFTPEAFARAFAINATGPALIAKHLLPLLARDKKAVFAVLSARVGSIGDNQLGGWAAYRASKAALHQIVRTCAIELARRSRTAVCVALHPGTVDTALSQPFQRGVAAEKLLSPAVSAATLLQVLDNITPAQSGQILAWDGSRIAY